MKEKLSSNELENFSVSDEELKRTFDNQPENLEIDPPPGGGNDGGNRQASIDPPPGDDDDGGKNVVSSFSQAKA